MRIAFAGTPDVAVPTLRALAASEHDIAVVITRPDAPIGRKRVLTPSPVAAVATELGIPVIKAARLDTEVTAQIAAYEPELGVIVAYGGLVKEPLLSDPRHGWINLHFSALPQWRGAAPVQRALMAGDSHTALTVFQLVAALDAGDVFASVAVPFEPDATAGESLAALGERGADVVVNVVNDIAAGSATSEPQSGEATVAAKLQREDGRVDWHRDSGSVYAHIRGVTPEPGAFTTIHGAPFKILRASRSGTSLRPEPGEIVADANSVVVGTATAPLALVTVQPAGKGAMNAADWWRGQRAEMVKAGS